MAIEVAPAVGFLGHHSSWSKRTCKAAWGRPHRDSKMPGSEKLFKGKNKYGLCFARKGIFSDRVERPAIRINRR
jgi:hypothetical protein